MWKLRIEIHLPFTLTVALTASKFTGFTMKYIIFCIYRAQCTCTPDEKYRKFVQKSFATEFDFASNLGVGSAVVQWLTFSTRNYFFGFSTPCI